MFDILRAGDKAVASTNENLKGTQKRAIEAIRSRLSPSRGPRFAQKYRVCIVLNPDPS